MARPRKKKAAKRVGARSSSTMLNPRSPLVQYGSIALGIFAVGKPLNAQIDRLVPASLKISSNIIAVGEGGLGYALGYARRKKSLITTVAGGILIGAAVKRVMGNMGVGGIRGFDNVRAVNGFDNVRAVNGSNMRMGLSAGSAGRGYQPAIRGRISNAMMDGSMV